MYRWLLVALGLLSPQRATTLAGASEITRLDVGKYPSATVWVRLRADSVHSLQRITAADLRLSTEDDPVPIVAVRRPRERPRSYLLVIPPTFVRARTVAFLADVTSEFTERGIDGDQLVIVRASDSAIVVDGPGAPMAVLKQASLVAPEQSRIALSEVTGMAARMLKGTAAGSAMMVASAGSRAGIRRWLMVAPADTNDITEIDVEFPIVADGTRQTLKVALRLPIAGVDSASASASLPFIALSPGRLTVGAEHASRSDQRVPLFIALTTVAVLAIIVSIVFVVQKRGG